MRDSALSVEEVVLLVRTREMDTKFVFVCVCVCVCVGGWACVLVPLSLHEEVPRWREPLDDQVPYGGNVVSTYVWVQTLIAVDAMPLYLSEMWLGKSGL